MFPSAQLLVDPEFENVVNDSFLIPQGWTVGMVKNNHATANVLLVNVKGKTMTLEPGEVYGFPYRAAGRSALTVNAVGSSAQIGFEL
jgi:hypothetical protein